LGGTEVEAVTLELALARAGVGWARAGSDQVPKLEGIVGSFELGRG
jgi:hypothetical protein